MDAYEDDNTGGLEFDEIEGNRPEDGDVMLQMVDEFQKEKDDEKQRLVSILKGAAEAEEENTSSDDEMDLIEVDEEPKEKWDCQTIISTYSNIYHHPKLISEPSKKVTYKNVQN